MGESFFHVFEDFRGSVDEFLEKMEKEGKELLGAEEYEVNNKPVLVIYYWDTPLSAGGYALVSYDATVEELEAFRALYWKLFIRKAYLLAGQVPPDNL